MEELRPVAQLSLRQSLRLHPPLRALTLPLLLPLLELTHRHQLLRKHRRLFPRAPVSLDRWLALLPV